MAADPRDPQPGDKIRLAPPWGLVEVVEVNPRRITFKLLGDDEIRQGLEHLKAQLGGELPERLARLENPPLSIKRKHWISKLHTEG